MKKRNSPAAKVRPGRLPIMGSLHGSSAVPEAKPLSHSQRPDMRRSDTSLTIVKGPHFQALLDLIDNPPQVSEELRRKAVAARLWK